MKSQAVLGILLSLLLAGMLILIYAVQPVKADSSIEVVGHKITPFEWEELKQKVGVWEEAGDHNQIIDGHGTGARSPTQEEWAKILEEAYVVDEILWTNQMADPPSSVDHTSSCWFPPIGDQDYEGSCVAWAVGYYMKTFQEAKEHGWDLSGAVWEGGHWGHPTQAYQDRIFSPDFIYHLINYGVDGGTTNHLAMNLIRSIGACTWEKMPYDPFDSTSWPSEAAWREAPLYRGNNTAIQYMSIDTDSDITDLKNWIASDHLAVITVNSKQYKYLTGDDVWTLDNYAGGIGHANTIVGYDDNLEYIEEGENRHGAFKVANSWGKWWQGDHNHDGCYWISYEAMKQRLADPCMFYYDRIGYEPELVMSFRIDHSKRAECWIIFGMGNPNAPIQTKVFNDYVDGGYHPFCPNNIVLDVTEFKDAVPTVCNQSFFMKVYDWGSPALGTITLFSIEYYCDYSFGNLFAKSTSHDVPLNTRDQDYVFLELAFHIWTVDDDGPADFHTIQEAIDAPETLDGHTIFVETGTYYENVFLYKSLTLWGENSENTIVDGGGSGDGINVVANNVTIAGFTFQNGHGGISIGHSSGNTIIDNIITSNELSGIEHYHSNDNIIHDNKVTLNSHAGIWLINSSNNAITYNTVSNNSWQGILVGDFAEYNTVSSNVVRYNEGGVTLDSADHNTVSDNVVSENSYDGILLVSSNDTRIEENIMTLNYVGIRFDNSTNNIITHNTATANVWSGIFLHSFSNNNTIQSNKVTHNEEGILLASSNSNVIDTNEAVENGNGIHLYESCYNEVSHNNASINDWSGIMLEASSNNNTLVSNNIANNYNGVILENSSRNNIYHNNFINNVIQGTSNPSINFWDDGYPSGGNYWTDNLGVDVKSGPSQDQPGSDGIGDKPYVIDGNNRDNYPLMYPWGAPPPPSYTLIIHSSPTGVTFIVDGVSRTTPWSGTYTEGSSVSLAMPETHDGYVWSHWLEDGDPNRIKTILLQGTTWTAVYEPVPKPVGGKATPINIPMNKAETPTLLIWLTTIILSLAVTVGYVKKRKRNTEINS